MKLSFTTLDVFTTTPYLGNPLAVIRVPASLRKKLTEDQKQKIAREFNLSEVTFLHEPENDADIVDFDIFTSLARITFAGHPTIGTALYIARNAATYPGIKKLKTLAGTIPFKYDEQARTATVAIPHDVHIHSATLPHPTESAQAVPIVSIVKGMAFALCELPSPDALSLMSGPLIAPNDRYNAQFLDDNWNFGPTGSFYYVQLALYPAEPGVTQLRTRYIPAFEDPGTGSASGALCCYLCITKGITGLQKFHLIQGVDMGRRCDIHIDVEMSKDGGRVGGVRLSGSAVQVMEGSLAIN
jgi:predicted PhzF superfamily epimerase YddE/YHI9